MPDATAVPATHLARRARQQGEVTTSAGGANADGPASRSGSSAVLASGVGVGVAVTVLTEMLSQFHALTRPGILVGWGALAVLAALAWYRCGMPWRHVDPGFWWRPGRLRPRSLPEIGPRLPSALMMGWVAAIASITLVGALFSVPKTWDSLTYHLARVAHWAQAGSVSFYPTHIVRQLYQPPWAEYAIAHLYLIAGSDRLVNLVQWAASMGCVYGVALLARQLGGGRRAQILAAFVCATIPMGILQASTTQNDYVTALWLVCLVYWLGEADRRGDALPLGFAGAALGLALLTKGTVGMFAAPFVAAFFVRDVSRGIAVAVRRMAAIVAVAAAVCVPHAARNVSLFGSPIGPGGEAAYTYANQVLSFPAVASNVLRNAALHLGTPWPGVNGLLETGVRRVHDALGLSPEDPRTTWPGSHFAVSRPSLSEDFAGSGLHAWLLGAAVILALIRSGQAGTTGRARTYALCIAGGVLVFCASVRWQPWHGRLHLPLLVLGAAAVAVMLERWGPRTAGIVALLLWVGSLPFLLKNPRTPLTGATSILREPRTVQRVAHIRVTRPEYLEAARFISGTACPRVALDIGGNDPEYLLWWLLRSMPAAPHVEHGFVPNVSRLLPPSPGPEPCVILRDKAGDVTGVSVGGATYRSLWSNGALHAFAPARTADSSAGSASPGPYIAVHADRAVRRPGEPVAVGLTVRTATTAPPAEVYLSVMRPDGLSAYFVRGLGMEGPIAAGPDASPPPMLTAWPGFVLNDPAFVRIDASVPGLTEPGRYEVVATLLRRRDPKDVGTPADVLVVGRTHLVVRP